MDNELEIFLRGGHFKKLIEEKAGLLQEKYGLKKTELEILYFLSKSKDNNTSTDINRQLSMTKGHVSQAVFSLVESGYLTAVTDREDRRYVHYALTEKAREIVGEFSVMREKLNRRILAGIPEEDLVVFERVAKQMWKNMNDCANRRK